MRFYKPLVPQMKYLFLALIPMLLVTVIVLKYNLIYLLSINVFLVVWAFIKGVRNAPLYTRK